MITLERYKELYEQSLDEPEKFWGNLARTRLDWYSPFETTKKINRNTNLSEWFSDGQLNVSFNCLDRHVLNGNGDKVAFHWEGNDGESVSLTYKNVLNEVSKLANALRKQGVQKGDRVCIYMPMIPEAIYAMLACTRVGAVHSVVFAGFSTEALRARIEDCGAKVIISAKQGKRGDKLIDLLSRIETVLDSLELAIVKGIDTPEQTRSAKLVSYEKIVASESTTCEPEKMYGSDPMFILYTSGSTGKPKGVLHTTAGYLLYANATHHYAFDIQPYDIYWCAADVGWITGHSYIVYGPLSNGVTSVVFEGIPTYPNPDRYWEIVDKYKVTIFYSTPTAIRSLMSYGGEPVEKHSRDSLRILGTVGEPINPEAWRWYHEVVGKSRCHIVDTWWQTETGGHAILSFVEQTPKPGCAMFPFFGIKPVLLDENNRAVRGEGAGALVIKGDWPGKLQDLYGDTERFKEVYLDPYPGYFNTGDGAHRDKDGHYWIDGRIDDTLNVSGRLIGTAEVESALVQDKAVAEAAVIGRPHSIKGTQICAFVVLMKDATANESVEARLRGEVTKQIGSFAKPDLVFFVPDLPKTRSGKIMRRLLRKVAQGQISDLGDTSTLSNPEIIQQLAALTF